MRTAVLLLAVTPGAASTRASAATPPGERVTRVLEAGR